MTVPHRLAEVTALYCGTVIDVRHVGRFEGDALLIGQGHEVWLPAPIAYPSLPIVGRDAEGFVLCLSAEMSGSIRANGVDTPIEASIARLADGNEAAIDCGDLRFEIRLVEAARLDIGRRAPEWPLLASLGGAAVVMLGLITILLSWTEDPKVAGRETGPRQARFARYMEEPAPEAPPQRSLRAAEQSLAPAQPKRRRQARSPSKPTQGTQPASPAEPKRTRSRGLRGPSGWSDPTGEPTYEQDVLDRDYDPMDEILGTGVVGAMGDDDPAEEILAAGSYNPNATTIDEAFRAWANSDIAAKGVVGELTLQGDLVGGGTADKVVDVPPELLMPGGGKAAAVSKVQVRGELDSDSVRSALKRGAKSARRCFESVDRPPETVIIALQRSQSGDITATAKGTFPGKRRVQDCLEVAAKTWELPEADAPSRIRFQLEL